MRNTKITFVCTGNTCRSPMAEYLLKTQLSNQPRFIINSAGLCDMSRFGPQHASIDAIDAMFDVGIDITAHRAQELDLGIASEAEFIFAMTEYHVETIKRSWPWIGDKVYTLSPKGSISDPYGGSYETYEKTRNEIWGHIMALSYKIKNGEL